MTSRMGTYCCGTGLHPACARQAIMGNTIYRTGRSGIDGVYSNKDIGYNDIYDFGLINTDMGAIYAANGAEPDRERASITTGSNDAKNDASHQFPSGPGFTLRKCEACAGGPQCVLEQITKMTSGYRTGFAAFSPHFQQHHGVNRSQFLVHFPLAIASSPANPAPTKPHISTARHITSPIPRGATRMTSGTDPRFVNVGEGGLKYRLETMSPAIDRGAVIAGVTDGYVGGA